MAGLFSRLGFKFSKPTVKVTVPPDVEASIRKINDARKALYGKDTVETAEMYDRMLPTSVIQSLMSHHDYLCLQWGSRKVARLVNLCRNILDVEIYTEDSDLDESHREHAFGLLVWMCWLAPIPIKACLIRGDADEHFHSVFTHLLTKEHNLLSEVELKLVLSGVFEGVQTTPGNPLLDIFHDALRFEEAQFGYEVNEKQMRTTLGKNSVFKMKAKKDSHSNLTPHWLFVLQELKELSGLVDRAQSMKDEAYAEKDGITT